MKSRSLVAVVAVVMLASGLFALGLPVLIDAYDQWGSQIDCGNGFASDLSQASIAEHGGDPEAGGTAVAPSGRNYLGLCNQALALRRGWTIPVAVLGWGILTWLAVAELTHGRRELSEKEPTGRKS